MASHQKKLMEINALAQSIDLDLQSLLEIVSFTEGSIIFIRSAGEETITFYVDLACKDEDLKDNVVVLEIGYSWVRVEYEVEWYDLGELRY